MKRKFDDPEALEKQINAYFDSLKDDEGRPVATPTLSGLALSLGVTRRTLTNYIAESEDADAGKSKSARCGQLLTQAKARIEAYLEGQLISRSNTHGIEFALMNGYGWGAKNTVDLKGGVELEHKSKVSTPLSRLSDEELLDQMRILSARLSEIMKREELDGNAADG